MWVPDVQAAVAEAVSEGAVVTFAIVQDSRAAVTLLERHMDPAEAWAVLGCFYGVIGGVFYLAATRRRRR